MKKLYIFFLTAGCLILIDFVISATPRDLIIASRIPYMVESFAASQRNSMQIPSKNNPHVIDLSQLITDITEPITNPLVLTTFTTIEKRYPQLKDKRLVFRSLDFKKVTLFTKKNINDSPDEIAKKEDIKELLVNYLAIAIEDTNTRYVINYPCIKASSDASFLFIIFHEFQHLIHHDAEPLYFPMEKSYIIDCFNKEFEEPLTKKEEEFVKKQIIRYRELRADSRALQQIECPYCAEEIALERKNFHSTYTEDGYISHVTIGQYAIKLRSQEPKKICRHHQHNRTVDGSIKDRSTCIDRLVIIPDPHNVPLKKPVNNLGSCIRRSHQK
jgi:hypothetical protein